MDEISMKQNWRAMCAMKDCPINRSAADEIVNDRRKTSLTRLAQRYRNFMILGIMWAIISLCQVHHGVLIEAFGRPGVIGLVFYFLLCAAMDYMLYAKVRSIDPLRMPTLEVIRRSYECRKLHILCIVILLPLVFLWGWWVIYIHHISSSFLWGMGFGAFVGGCAGVYQLRKFLADYRSITSE